MSEDGEKRQNTSLGAKLNSSLSASRGPRPAPTHSHTHQERSGKTPRRNYQHSEKRHPEHHRDHEKREPPLPYHIKHHVREVIRKPVAAPLVEANEYGRHVARQEPSPHGSLSSLRLYAKNFVPTIDANPHIEQIRGGIVTVKKEHELDRILRPDAPQMPYRRRRGEVKSVVHWGQRKLMISEIEFLTMHAEDDITVVYAGSAPGTHIPFLSRLFPTVNFVLVDPSEFNCQESERIKIRHEFMTNEIAAEYAGTNALLISDIRSGDCQILDNAEMDRVVQRDMSWQQQWHLTMRPKAGMYKFRLPWTAGETEYICGDVFLPVWGPQTTTETRLISTSFETRRYDNRVYEEQMFYFNNVTRCCLYAHDVAASGLDHCFDCSSEVHVLKKYLNKHFRLHFPRSRWDALTELDVQRKCSALVDSLTVECGGSPGGRNLLQWQKHYSARIPASVPREFDTDNLKVVKFSPAELKYTSDVLRLQNANAARVLQHAYESTKTARSSNNAAMESEQNNGAAAAAYEVRGWSGLDEVVMEDVGWNAGRSGRFGGTHVAVKTAVDAWLWGAVAELAGVRERWVEPPFATAAANAAIIAQQEKTTSSFSAGVGPTAALAVVSDESSSVEMEQSNAAAAAAAAVVDNDTLSVAKAEDEKEHAMEDEDEVDQDEHEESAFAGQGLQFRRPLPEYEDSAALPFPPAHTVTTESTADEATAEQVGAFTHESELHSSLFLTEAAKFELVENVWNAVVSTVGDHAWLHNEKLHKVLILLCRSGSAFFFCPDLIAGTAAKFQLPPTHPEQHHLTLLVGLLDFHLIQHPKKLHLLGFHSVRGEKVAGEWSSEEQQTQLRTFLAEEFNFESPSRALVLNMNGFKVIDSI